MSRQIHFLVKYPNLWPLCASHLDRIFTPKLLSVTKRYVRRGEPVIRHSRSTTTVNFDPDPFGISNMTNKELAGVYGRGETMADDKYKLLLMKRSLKANEDSVTELPFGTVRKDSENVPKYHGQFNPNNEKPAFDVDEFVSETKENAVSVSNENVVEERATVVKDIETDQPIDIDSIFPKRTTFRTSDYPSRNVYDFAFAEEWNEIRNMTPDEPSKDRKYKMKNRKVNVKPSIHDGVKEDAANSPVQSVSELDQELEELKLEEIKRKDKELRERQAKVVEESKPRKMTYDDLGGEKMSGFEFVQKLRRGEIESEDKELEAKIRESDPNALDNQGFYSYKEYTLDLTTLRRRELLWLLKKSVIFADAGIVAINKPHGLITQGKINQSPIPSLAEMLDEFADILHQYQVLPEKPEKLHLVHRLDKEATGVLVLATNSEKAALIHELFEQRKVFKMYHVITKCPVEPPDGIIDIPIEEGSIGDKERMVLRPELREELRRIVSPSKHARRAVTVYKTLAAKGNAALLEVTPETGVKHQIRVHLGFGLRAPILGDHKYSYLDKICPQKLPSDMLTSLNIRQPKVRNIPLHLHALTLSLPGAGSEGRTIFLRANHPSFFRTTMKRLKLTI